MRGKVEWGLLIKDQTYINKNFTVGKIIYIKIIINGVIDNETESYPTGFIPSAFLSVLDSYIFRLLVYIDETTFYLCGYWRVFSYVDFEAFLI